MTRLEFKEARARLGLSLTSAAILLGVSERQAWRYESGPGEIPEPVARLLWLMEAERITPQRFAALFNLDIPAI